jgi:hypothetical protein
MAICLTCKYEPDWSEPSGGNKYSRRHGKCKYEMDWPPMPYVYLVQTRPLLRYSDDSGLPTACPTWTKKDQEGGGDED